MSSVRCTTMCETWVNLFTPESKQRFDSEKILSILTNNNNLIRLMVSVLASIYDNIWNMDPSHHFVIKTVVIGVESNRWISLKALEILNQNFSKTVKTMSKFQKLSFALVSCFCIYLFSRSDLYRPNCFTLKRMLIGFNVAYLNWKTY